MNVPVLRFNHLSTAEQVVENIDLSGKCALVTGAAGGVGRETARALASAGASVTLAVRNIAAGEAAAVELGSETGRPIDVLPLDLMSPASIDACARAYIASGKPLHMLINNAGIMACPLERNADGIESQLQSNALGPLQLTLALAGLLEAAAPSRVVMVSSSAHRFSPAVLDDLNYERRPYDPMQAYGQSKSVLSLLAVALQKRLGRRGVTCLSVHPGVIKTNLMRYMPAGAMEAVEARMAQHNEALKSTEAGAATSVWAATAPELVAHGGAYLEDCQVAALCESPAARKGVLPYAVDAEIAEQLWQRLTAIAPWTRSWQAGWQDER